MNLLNRVKALLAVPREVIVAIRFVVLAGDKAVGFQAVSAIGKTGDFTYVTEGGNNQYPYLMRKPQESPHKLTFKRGVLLRKAGSGLGGRPQPLDPLRIIFERGTIGTILVIDQSVLDVRAIYSFVSQGVIEWSVSDLNAMQSEPFIETITIVHNGLMSIPVPEHYFQKKMFVGGSWI